MKEVKMRRYQNLLTVSGLGVIVLALWSVLKTILYFVLNRDIFNQAFAGVSDNALVKAVAIGMIAAILLIDLTIRLFVGMSARAEGFGKKKGYAYIILAVLLALLSLTSLVLIFFNSSGKSITEMIVSVIVEATSLIVVIELLVAAFTVKKLRKELGEVK